MCGRRSWRFGRRWRGMAKNDVFVNIEVLVCARVKERANHNKDHVLHSVGVSGIG